MGRKRTAPKRKGTRRQGTGRRTGPLALLAGFILLIAIGGGVYAWWTGQHWRPDESAWPDQGAVVGADDGPVDFVALKGVGADFVYLEASAGEANADARFASNLAAARAAGMQVGAVHRFDPCLPADGQSANFVTVVPRDSDLLPSAIRLDRLAEDCSVRVSDAAVQSELMTLVNQIEAHTGKALILAPSADFEAAYGIARRLDRNLWLTRNWREPDYGGRPWLLWTANEGLRTEAAEAPLRWVVVRP